MATLTAIDPIETLKKDLKTAAETLSDDEARYLVDYLYVMQDDRKRANNQIKAMAESDPVEEPHDIVKWLASTANRLELEINKSLDVYSSGKEIGVWAKGIVGIGPVIAAGLLAHIDITKAPTAGHIWSFAGLNTNRPWIGKAGAAELLKPYVSHPPASFSEDLLAKLCEDHKFNYLNVHRDATTRKDKPIPLTRASVLAALAKRPYNAQLKTLCWKIGESFVKFSNHVDDFYGAFYRKRKAFEIASNEAGNYAGQAADKLVKFKIGRDTEAYGFYSRGRLPPAHIHARAKRWTVKLFLAHYQQKAWEFEYGTPAPLPYAIQNLGHADFIRPP